MHSFRFGFLGIAFSLVLAPFSGAFAEPGPKADTEHTSVELVSEYEAAAPGVTQWIGLYFKPKDGWHVYWKNPGDAGLPPKVEYGATPAGSKFGPLEFPTPERIPYGPLVNYGYEDSVLYPSTWVMPDDLKDGGNVTVTASVKWLVCKEECVPGRATLSLKLPVGTVEGLKKASGTHTKFFAAAVDSLSKPADGKIRLVMAPDGSHVDIAYSEGKPFPKSNLTRVFFFPEGEYGIGADAKQVATSTADGLFLTVPRKEKKPVGEIRGVLKIAEGKSYLVSEVIDPKLLAGITGGATKPVSTAPSPGALASLPLMLLFAFVGGLILNLMPCILPVLSIKVIGIANQSGSDRAGVRRHGLVFTLGILVSFWALAAILLTVRSSGQVLGWGFQLQNPIFVGSLAVLFYVMALNLFGIFEIGDRLIGVGGNLATKEGYAGSFFTGVLTTVAATPCSAPFMGSALGFALTQSAFVAVLVLTTLALGLAFPYLLFSYLPAASKILPRPGIWMKTLKEVLAFPLLATVIWLASVIGNQTGTEGMFLFFSVILAATVAVWLIGKPTKRLVPTTAKWILISLSVLFMLATLSSLGSLKSPVAGVAGAKSPLVHEPWRDWSPEAQAKAIAAGKTVLVNFTAGWCVTCKVNETVVFDREAVKAALSKDSVVALLADWTNGDPAITAALAKVSRNSVPVYLVFKPGVADPKVLPQLLSVDGLLAEIR
jgi:thiol:disulfide interchange protein/DsbC/DsbD-like thiol-disulfide interchange protein